MSFSHRLQLFATLKSSQEPIWNIKSSDSGEAQLTVQNFISSQILDWLHFSHCPECAVKLQLQSFKAA